MDRDEHDAHRPPPRATLEHWLEIALWPGISSDPAANNRLLREAHMRAARTIVGTGPLAATAYEHQIMRVIPDPGRNSGAIIAGGARPGAPRPVVKGSGDVDLVCGSCGFIICRAIGNPRSFANLLFRCPSCEHVLALDPADRTGDADPAVDSTGDEATG